AAGPLQGAAPGRVPRRAAQDHDRQGAAAKARRGGAGQGRRRLGQGGRVTLGADAARALAEQPGRGLRVLVVDNYDSFVYNLVQYLGELGAETVVWRNDAATVDDVRALDPDGVVISPGPGHPRDARLSVDIVSDLGEELPILGVCLGHQVIGHVYGGAAGPGPALGPVNTPPPPH